jgi:hypothetical protein
VLVRRKAIAQGKGDERIHYDSLDAGVIEENNIARRSSSSAHAEHLRYPALWRIKQPPMSAKTAFDVHVCGMCASILSPTSVSSACASIAKWAAFPRPSALALLLLRSLQHAACRGVGRSVAGCTTNRR